MNHENSRQAFGKGYGYEARLRSNEISFTGDEAGIPARRQAGKLEARTKKKLGYPVSRDEPRYELRQRQTFVDLLPLP